MAMKENSKNVLNYLKENKGVNLTAADVAEALGLEKRQVDGILLLLFSARSWVFVPLLRLSLRMEPISKSSSSLLMMLVWLSIPMLRKSNRIKSFKQGQGKFLPLNF